MRIEPSMIHPELRKTGAFIRLVLPSYTLRKFRMAGVLINTAKGKCRSKLNYTQQYIPRGDGTRLRVCIYSPASPQKNVPGLLWMHGGGYAFGTPELDELFIKRFIEASGCVVMAPDYRLSTDEPYPAALEDCYTALVWMKNHSGDYGIRADQLLIGGDSAGGGLTAALSLYARDKNEVAIAFQMPLYPMLDDRMNTPSATDNDAPLWNSKSNEIAWRLYLGQLFGKPNIPAYAAPARAETLANLPPACSFVGSLEPFRDETVAYMERLRASGTPVDFKVFEGCFHGFDVACRRTAIAKQAAAFMLAAFRHAVANYFAQQPDAGSNKVPQ